MMFTVHMPLPGSDLLMDTVRYRSGLVCDLLAKPGGRDHYEEPYNDERERGRETWPSHLCLNPSLQWGEDQRQRASPDQGRETGLGQAVAQVDAHHRKQCQRNRSNASARPTTI